MSAGKTKRKKNLLIDHPAWTERLSEEWDWEKNDEMGIKPNDVTAGSHKKAAWRCEKGHGWEAAIYSRIGQGQGCPYCSGRRILTGFNDLGTTDFDIASELHPTKNGYLIPEMVTRGSGRKVWWLGKCGHEWQQVISNRTLQEQGCPLCAKASRAKKRSTPTVGVDDLASQYPEIASEWHPTKNGKLTPENVKYGSRTKVWWLGSCGHEWQQTVSSRTNRGCGCPKCANKERARKRSTPTVGVDDLASQYPEIASEWHPTKNGKLTPENVKYGSRTKVWWLGSCGHEWQQAVGNRALQRQGCPTCSYDIRAKKMATPIRGVDDLLSQRPDVTKEWHPYRNGNLSPCDVRLGSERRVWWLCSRCGHEWAASVKNRTQRESGCPKCASSHGEKDAASWAKSQGFVVDEQWRHPECRDQNPLPFDLMLYVPVGNALMEASAVEYDGVQHSDETTYFNQKNLARGGISYVQRHDAIKTNFCLLSHRVLIRVPHTVTGGEAIGEYISGRLVENGLGWWLDDVDGDAV